ncbi:MAG: hypothetical protein LBM09_02830 [Candidatus Nomurabacteria bacterium]|jgi:hypothetical protein|nr:hypothetical protein [Candidatus Nomurabacteria bacterium]
MKTAILLDLDRTIFDTNRFWQDVSDRIEAIYGAEKLAEVKRVWDEKLAQSNIVDAKSIYGKSGVDIDKISVTGDYIFPDAREFLKNNENAVILSAGDDFTQRWKAASAGLKLPMIVVDESKKAQWLAKNCERADGYEILGQKFDAIEFYDDTISNFVGFEKLTNAKGWLIARTDKTKQAIKTAVLPENVKIIAGFSEISNRL